MRKRAVSLAAIVGLAASLGAAPQGRRPAPPEARTLLLVDDHDVLYRAGTRRVLNPPARHPRNPVIGDERPYEKTVAYCSVHRDRATGKYQLWYQAWAGKGAFLCYATSDDGVAWTKPDLGLVAYEGSTRNNIVLAFSGGGSVLHDPRDPDAARRYKALYLHRGLTAAFSPDGVHWKVHPEKLFRRYSWRPGQPPLVEEADGPGEPRQTLSDVIDVAFDPVRRVFMAYAKSWIDSPAGETIWRRCVVRLDSGDFLHWSAPRLVAWPDEHDDARLTARARAAGGPDTMAGGGSRGAHMHSGPTFHHEGVYFTLLQMIDSAVTGQMPAELGISRDGLGVERPFRDTPFIPTDGGTRFDSGAIWTNATPVVLDDEIRFYYGAYVGTWQSEGTLVRHPTGIGLAVLARDRFAGLRPTSGVGQVTLKPVDLTGIKRIMVNAAVERGAVRVELLDEFGWGVRGFTKADAVAIPRGGLRQPAAWSGRTLADLAPGRYMPRLHLEGDATVYALRLSSD